MAISTDKKVNLQYPLSTEMITLTHGDVGDKKAIVEVPKGTTLMDVHVDLQTAFSAAGQNTGHYYLELGDNTSTTNIKKFDLQGSAALTADDSILSHAVTYYDAADQITARVSLYTGTTNPNTGIVRFGFDFVVADRQNEQYGTES